jgi:hypothetical protein
MRSVREDENPILAFHGTSTCMLIITYSLYHALIVINDDNSVYDGWWLIVALENIIRTNFQLRRLGHNTGNRGWYGAGTTYRIWISYAMLLNRPLSDDQ